MRSYKVGIKTARDPEWVYNALRFATEEKARAYGIVLFYRWMAVTEYEVHESDDPINLEGGDEQVGEARQEA